MKKQNGINKFAFNKAAVTELNGTQLTQINGGTSWYNNDFMSDRDALTNPYPIGNPQGITLL